MSTTASLEFADSFDHYTLAEMVQKWTTATGNISFVAGRNGTGVKCLGGFSSGAFSKVFSDPRLITMSGIWMTGFAFQHNGNLASGNFSVIYTATSSAAAGYIPLQLVIFADQTLGVVSGNSGVWAASFPAVLQANVWYFIELMFSLSGIAGGTVTVSGTCDVNGVNQGLFSLAGNMTVPSGGAETDGHLFTPPNNSFGTGTWDDVYIAVPLAISDAYFYGDVKVVPYFATSDDGSNQWTGNHTDINSNPPNDGLFIASTTAPQKSMFGFQAITGSTAYLAGLSIPAIQSVLRTEFASSSETIVPLVGTFASPGTGTSIKELSLTFAFYQQPWDVDPVTSAVWSPSLYNGYEYGVEETHV